MNAYFLCPKCGYTQTAPEAFIGRKSRCPKCEAAGEIIAGEPRAQKKPQTSVPVNVDISPNESSPAPTETETPKARGKANAPRPDDTIEIDTTRSKNPTVAATPVNAFEPSSNVGSEIATERYPNLTLYLKIAATVTRILAVIAAGFFVLSGLMACAQTLFFSDAEILFKVARTSVTLLGLAFGLLLIYLYYVAFMAIIELIRVVMDIERNTRRP
ncbi:hypothetical protein [Allorhodopirellula heiligendammensis]|uniref:DUF4282 domain-containing protein n=1 Tax=Allorhodopirellula heiligendammensis TaxID=2714739 RepID=A0A5C6BY87_9BACT|nr:hypothetical protein [Allorhodopirellula heiligendammensis]TWU16838.1 hypothetical protein Poly21_40450 [Allorhodopirellula heiligendammensis]